MSTFSLQDIPDQTGRVAIVTGANSGIGLETARGLALRGAHVVLACRNPTRAAAAVEDIRTSKPEGPVEVMSLDLSDLASVAAFSESFLARHSRLDLLINNAGVMVPPQSETSDGFELQFGTNHLGHFALTLQLLEWLKQTPGSRVVNVSSIAHRGGRIDFDNLAAEKGYRAWGAYGQSKLANLLFTLELQRRLEGSGVLVTAAHPGWTATNLQANSPSARFFNRWLAMTPPEGALPTLFAATAPSARPAGYYGPSRLFEMRGPVRPASRTKRALDAQVARRLWQVSEQLTGVRIEA